MPFINKYLQLCDIFFLQEHWMSHGQLSHLSGINSDFLCSSVSGFNSDKVLCGRPYGGCAILWRKSINAIFKCVPCESNRFVAVSMLIDDMRLLLINVYLPCESSNDDNTLDEFISELSKFACILDNNQDAFIVIGGDFNVDFCRSTIHTQLLSDFLDTRGLVRCQLLSGYNVDYTYNFDGQRFSTLDHFMVSESLADLPELHISVAHDVDNTSDHDPVTLNLPLTVNRLPANASHIVRKPAWYKCSEEQLQGYKCNLSLLLHSIDIPVSALLCTNILCNDMNHSSSLNSYSRSIIDCCTSAAVGCVPSTGAAEVKRVPGWNEHVQPFKEKALFGIICG